MGCMNSRDGGGPVVSSRNPRPAAAAASASPSSRDPSAELTANNGQNRPLKAENPQWTAKQPMTTRELVAKREEFWSTAPAFEGRKEIWDALKAACETEDLALAQAIVDSAQIKLPSGSLTNAYDELGTRYSVPVFCLSEPSNYVKGTDAPAATKAGSEDAGANSNRDPEGGEPIAIKLRLSLGKDLVVNLRTTDTLAYVKQCVGNEADLKPSQLRLMYIGRSLRDKQVIDDLNLGKADVVQVMVFPLQ